MDIDDYELSFFQERSPLSLDEIARRLDENDLSQPFGETWTRFVENLLPLADGVLVSNYKLHDKYGGAIIPHARDEKYFNPELYDRVANRHKLGIRDEEKIILFAGTPRRHKGLFQLLDAVKKCNNKSYKVCLVGSPPDEEFNRQLKALSGDRLIMIPNRPFNELPNYLVIADVICILQDPNSEISQYQLPAKVVDALAMGIPIIATRVPPLEPLIDAGLIIPVDFQNVSVILDDILNNSRQHQNKQREIFLANYSYSAILPKLEKLIEDTLNKPKPFIGEVQLARMIDVQRQIRGKCDNQLHVEELFPNTANTNGKFDIVLFWKQNDTGLYGRRSDMMVKYLAQRPEVRRILMFDRPIALENLFHKAEYRELTHDRDVFIDTLLRSWGLRDNEKVKYRTFIYKTTADLKQTHISFVAKCLNEAYIEPSKSIFWIYPQNYFVNDLINYFRPKHIIVDIVDDHRTWPGQKPAELKKITAHYEELISKADLVMANCETVQQAIKKFRRDIKLVPNACELEPAPSVVHDTSLQWLKNLRGPKLGFVGNLEIKIDIELLQYLSVNNPEWQIVLIGSTHANPQILELEKLPNIHFLGVIRYPEVKAFINEFDVGIVPHLDIELTRSMNPLKIFVYLSLGIPVVTTRIANLGEAERFVCVADTKESFSNKVKECLNKGKPPMTAELKAFLEENSWPHRIDSIIQWLEDLSRNDMRTTQTKNEPSATSSIKLRLANESRLSNNELNETEGKNDCIYGETERKTTSKDDIHQQIVKEFRQCPICNTKVRIFLPFGERLRANALCPSCGSLERHRLIYLYFKEKTDIFTKNIRMLHVAPERIFAKIFLQRPNIDYVSTDIDPNKAMVSMDLQNLKFGDNSFDVIYCSHVFEHIPDDRKAMKEVYRVLKPGGWAILQVPIKYNTYKTLEDPTIKSPEDRSKYYGQRDHLRYYGLDYEDKLKDAGFIVKVDNFVDTLDKEIIERYALPSKEYIYFCTKEV